MHRFLLAATSFALVIPVHAQDESALVDLVRKADFKSFSTKEEQQHLADQVWKAMRSRRDDANERSSKAWSTISTKAEWEAFRDPAIQALRTSLGQFPPVPNSLNVKVTGTLKGDGFIVENLLYESRPGLFVTANLYVPEETGKAMPGIVIIHSHHNAKTQNELQDMGMTWARLGCLVLVPDQLGHGERRQHPFTAADKFAGQFKPGRQDYYFRYNSGVQLHLIGDSLVGWMAWDMMRGIDLLLARPGIEKKGIILLGSVAGGGDPAGVTAAIDPRIAAVVPFNFGGPQPETKFPLPADAERAFNYVGGGSWESTRNLAFSGRDGFLPWVIVGSVAPRRLIHAHEFAWDSERDPVWKRYRKIFALYDAAEGLSSAHGSGSVRGSPPESTHCNNIGAVHRKPIYPAFKKWFDMPIPDQEYQRRFPSTDLQCLTAEARAELKPRPLHELAGELGSQRGQAFRSRLAKLDTKERRVELRKKWSSLLGLTAEKSEMSVTLLQGKPGELATLWMLEHKTGTHPAEKFPFLLLMPPGKKGGSVPVKIGLAHDGRAGFLKHRAERIAELLDQGVAVCLPDFRGTGEMRTEGRGRTSASTSLSASELMLGRTLLGTRLEELGLLLRVLRSGKVVKAESLTLWGDSFTPTNDADRNLAMPLDADKLPAVSEPLGGLLALLGGLFHDDVAEVHIHGGLVGYLSILDSPFLYMPHDVVVPGALTAGDLCDVAAALAPRPLQLQGLVDGLNRRMTGAKLAEAYEPARAAYRAAAAGDKLSLSEQ